MTVTDAEAKILAAIAETLTQGQMSPSWVTQALARRPGLRRTISAILVALARDWQREVDATMAHDALVAARKARSAARFAPTPSRAKNPTVIAPPKAKTNLVRQIMPTVLRSADDVYRKAVARVMAQPITTEAARLDAVQSALDSLARQGVTGFVDKAGRRWNMTSYLEMATRTALKHAATDAYARELVSMGLDVVRVHSRESSCPRCAPFHGRLLSLSGDSTGPVGIDASGHLMQVVASLAAARRAGFEHPNCRCFVLPFIPGDDYVQVTAPDPAAYKAEQQLRAHERAVRSAKTQSALAVTSQRRSATRRRVIASQKALREHVSATGVSRQRHREQLAPR